MPIKKKYVKKNSWCKVTFLVSEEQIGNIDTIKLLGEFNNWDTKCDPMTKDKHGYYRKTILLRPLREYQFKYLVDDTFWELEPDADKFVPNGLGKDDYNAVVIT